MAQKKHSRTHQSSPGKAATRNLRPDSQAGLSNGLAYVLLIVFTLIAYANAWPDNLTFDDRVFVDSSRFSGLSPGEVLRFFTEDLWAASGGGSHLYRPLLLLLLAGESQVFGDWKEGYHLVTIGLHVLATLLVYGFVKQLLQISGHQRNAARQYSLLAALLFGVHPIHTEVVNSIFNGSEILVTIGVVGGLSWFLDCSKIQPGKAWLGLSLIYLLVLFFRESGAALPLLAVAMIWLTRSDSWQLRLRACIPVVSLLLPLGIYLALRSHALGPDAIVQGSGLQNAENVAHLIPLAHYSPGFGLARAPSALGTWFGALKIQLWPNLLQARYDWPEMTARLGFFVQAVLGLHFGLERVLPAAVMWFEALKILLWPHPLQVYYDVPEVNVWLALAAQVVLLAGAVVAYLRKRPMLLIGLVFFYLAILPSSRIIGQDDMDPDLFDRFLYLPSVGFTIMLAFGLTLLGRKFSLNAAVVAALIITAVLIPLTWARNGDWANDILLLETDYQKLHYKGPILNALLAAHLQQKNPGRAAEICDAHLEAIHAGADMGAHCGSAYGQLGRFRDAEKAYLSATRNPTSKVFAHFNLAVMYVHLGRRIEAEENFALAIHAENKPFLRDYFKALSLLQLHPSDRGSLLDAKSLLEHALKLQPQHVESRKELDSLNQQLSKVPPAR